MQWRKFGGAVGAGLLDAGLEALWASNKEYWTGRFPFVPTIEPLPPADDWIVLGVSAGLWAAGKYLLRNPMVEDIGEGMLFYSAPMIIHHTIVRYAEQTALRFVPVKAPGVRPPVTPVGRYVVTG